MSRAAEEYRALAETELRRAEATTLPNVRALAMQAAERWRILAERTEMADVGRANAAAAKEGREALLRE